MSNVDNEVRARVEALAAYGTPHKEIARVLRIDLEALRKDYEDELATGGPRPTAAWRKPSTALPSPAGARVDVTAAIFWLKARAGWKETTVAELALAEGKPVREELKIVFVEADMTRINALDAEDRERRLRIGESASTG